jgi:hypothetical protein
MQDFWPVLTAEDLLGAQQLIKPILYIRIISDRTFWWTGQPHRLAFQRYLGEQTLQSAGQKSFTEFLLEDGYPEAVSKKLRSRSVWFTSYIERYLFRNSEIMHHAKGEYHSKLSAPIRYLLGLTGNLIKYARSPISVESRFQVLRCCSNTPIRFRPSTRKTRGW